MVYCLFAPNFTIFIVTTPCLCRAQQQVTRVTYCYRPVIAVFRIPRRAQLGESEEEESPLQQRHTRF